MTQFDIDMHGVYCFLCEMESFDKSGCDDLSDLYANKAAIRVSEMREYEEDQGRVKLK